MTSHSYACQRLGDLPRDQYAKAWCALNQGDWYEGLPKPSNLAEMNDQERHEVVWPIMSEIMSAIGLKECLREWNRERMTPEEFEEFWSSNRVPTSVAGRLGATTSEGK